MDNLCSNLSSFITQSNTNTNQTHMLQIHYLQQKESLHFNIRSKERFQNLGQTSSWFGLERNTRNKVDQCMYQLLQILETILTDLFLVWELWQKLAKATTYTWRVSDKARQWSDLCLKKKWIRIQVHLPYEVRVVPPHLIAEFWIRCFIWQNLRTTRK